MAFLSSILDCLKKPVETDCKAQITATVIGILVGFGSDYYLETHAKTDDWLHDAAITSSITMGAAALSNFTIFAIRRCCLGAEDKRKHPWPYYLCALFLSELLGFAVGFGVGMAVDAAIETGAEKYEIPLDATFTPLAVSLARTSLRTIGFYAIENRIKPKGENSRLINAEEDTVKHPSSNWQGSYIK